MGRLYREGGGSQILRFGIGMCRAEIVGVFDVFFADMADDPFAHRGDDVVGYFGAVQDSGREVRHFLTYFRVFFAMGVQMRIPAFGKHPFFEFEVFVDVVVQIRNGAENRGEFGIGAYPNGKLFHAFDEFGVLSVDFTKSGFRYFESRNVERGLVVHLVEFPFKTIG